MNGTHRYSFQGSDGRDPSEGWIGGCPHGNRSDYNRAAMTTVLRVFTVSVALMLTALAPVSARRAVDIDSATIADLNAALKAGTLTSEKLVEMSLAQIQGIRPPWNPALRAFIAINKQRARDGACARCGATIERATQRSCTASR